MDFRAGIDARRHRARFARCCPKATPRKEKVVALLSLALMLVCTGCGRGAVDAVAAGDIDISGELQTVEPASGNYRTFTVERLPVGATRRANNINLNVQDMESVKVGVEGARLVDLRVTRLQEVKAGDVILHYYLENDGLELQLLQARLTETQREYEDADKALALAVEEREADRSASHAELDDISMYAMPHERELAESQVVLADLRLTKAEAERALKKKQGEIAMENIRADIKMLEEDIRPTAVTAKTDGIVVETEFISKDSVIPADLVVARICEPEKILIVFDGPFVLGQEVDMASGRNTYKGRIIGDNSAAEDGHTMFAAQFVTFPPIEELVQLLGRQMVISGTGPSFDDALVVPKNAVHPESGKQYVNILEDGVLKKRYIKTGFVDMEYFVVVQGLNEGDVVVIS